MIRMNMHVQIDALLLHELADATKNFTNNNKGAASVVAHQLHRLTDTTKNTTELEKRKKLHVFGSISAPPVFNIFQAIAKTHDTTSCAPRNTSKSINPAYREHFGDDLWEVELVN